MARKASKRRSAAPSTRSHRPALGNDPFERGAAHRPPPPPAPFPVPPPEPPAEVLPAPTPVEEAAVRLDRLESRLDEALDGAEARLARVARQTGPATYAEELRELLVRLLPALRDRLKPLASLANAAAVPRGQDPYGLDARLWEGARPLLDFLFESFWRVDVRGLSSLPEGPSVIVANRGGALPWDALVLRLALTRPPVGRELRPLLDAPSLASPVAGGLARRLGAVPATPGYAEALLRAGSLLGVFPEGSAAGSKPWSERYRLQRFGRGGFVRVAARGQVPIVPCAIVGSEEASAPFERRGWLAEALGLPLLALAPGLPLPPLAWLPLPSRWSIHLGSPVAPPPPRDADDPAIVAPVADQVRSTLQHLLDEDVAARKSVFL